MADKLLKSIKFPTLPDRYVIGDSTLTEEGAAADAKAVCEALATKADTKGRYEDIVAGGAEQLMADGYETDKEPYLFRPTGGSADVGNREYLDKIVGGTVAWNQLVPTTASSTADVTNNGDGSFTVASGKENYYAFTTAFSFVIGHKYLGMLQGGIDSTLYIRLENTVGNALSIKANYIINVSETLKPYIYLRYRNIAQNTKVIPQVIDLTAMFGSTIADYIYNLEKSQAGAGVAWFRNYFPKDYYPYDPGTLRSVEGVSAHEMVGFNQWDEEWEEGWIDTNGKNRSSNTEIRSKNFIPVIPNTAYYFNVPENVDISYYDENKQIIGVTDKNGLGDVIASSSDKIRVTHDNCYYIRFWVYRASTYNHDICINLSDPTRNGEYEPYQKHTYPLDSSLTLRGVPKLVDGKLAFDGDVYPPSGEVQRRYGLRAYQSGDESLADAITDGTNTVYKLTTPTTETADGYEQYQICDPSGTEEFVTDSIVPVGHETRYPHDLKKKIETAPDSPSTDGTYMMKRSGGKNSYMALPSTPSANGAYVLTVTVSGGTASYSWTAKE